MIAPKTSAVFCMENLREIYTEDPAQSGVKRLKAAGNTPLIVLTIFLLASAAVVHFLSRTRGFEKAPARQSLENFPAQLGNWKETEQQFLDERVLSLLKPDDYISRTYTNERGKELFLLLEYFSSQRSGQTYHSPQACLPGAGWTMQARDRLKMGLTSFGPAAGQGEINQFIVSQEDVRMMTLYWYQGRGRTVASEYWGKLFTVTDAVVRQRTDGSLIRVMLPIEDSLDGEQQALEQAVDFVNQIMPHLDSYIPR